MTAAIERAGLRGNRRAAAMLPMLLGLTACTITQTVQPVPSETPLSPLCLEENDTVWSKEFLPVLQKQFARYGIQTSVHNGRIPGTCQHHMTYTANWGWDMAVYLKYANLRIYRGNELIGEATYDARGGSFRLDKFGTTEAKLSLLVHELLKLNPIVGGA